MKNAILTLLVFTFSFSLYGQEKYEFDWNGKSFIDSLKQTGVDTFGIYKTYCVNPWFISETCQPKHDYFELYIYWKVAGDTYLKKFDNCFEYNSIQIDYSVLFGYYNNCKEKLKTEFIQPATSVGFSENGDTIFYTISVDHSCFDIVSVYYGKEALKFKFDESNFDKEINKFYYKRNRNLTCFSWKNLIVNQIQELEDKKMFKIL